VSGHHPSQCPDGTGGRSQFAGVVTSLRALRRPLFPSVLCTTPGSCAFAARPAAADHSGCGLCGLSQPAWGCSLDGRSIREQRKPTANSLLYRHATPSTAPDPVRTEFEACLRRKTGLKETSTGSSGRAWQPPANSSRRQKPGWTGRPRRVKKLWVLDEPFTPDIAPWTGARHLARPPHRAVCALNLTPGSAWRTGSRPLTLG